VAYGGTYSLAMAFLAAGASQVVATLRPVSDEGAAFVTEQLYQSGTTDLVRALWRVQTAAHAPGEGKIEDLSQFVVFGDFSCDAH
jgi:hypothetical protein